MEINVKKTKKMVVSKKNPVPDANILIDVTPIEQVTSVVHLGHMVTDDGKSDKNFLTIFSFRDTGINTRKHIVKYYVWTTFLYGSKMWTITTSVAMKINAFVELQTNA